jgi:hypothetical protein
VKLRFSSWDMASNRTEGWAAALDATKPNSGKQNKTMRVKLSE